VGSFDEGGDIKALIQNLFPHTDAPYRALESLMNTGFILKGRPSLANSRNLRWLYNTGLS
jgi:hypothetical protein